jgi:Cellulose biosynthesis protein BcsS
VAISSFLILIAIVPVRAQTTTTGRNIGIPSQSSPVPGAAPWMEGWTGGYSINNSYGGWTGMNFALNPSHNVWADGYILRVEGIAGHYDYSTASLGRVNATYEDGDVMLGYRKVIGATTLTGYIGIDVENQDIPDPTSYGRGTQAGVKVMGEVSGTLSPTQEFYGEASFSTALYSWFTMARTGFRVSQASDVQVWVGPEGQLLGSGKGQFSGDCINAGVISSCRYDEGRVGGYLHLVIPNEPQLGDWVLDGGYRKPLVGNSADGYYAQLELNFHF